MSKEDDVKKGISRRDFVRGAAIVAGAGMLVGCTQSGEATEALINAATEEAVATATKPVEPTASQAVAEPCVTQAAAAQTTTPEYMTAEMAAKKWAFEIPPDPIPDSQIANTVETEIVVVGSGTAGLCCANAAVENGAKVVLISGSKGPISRGGSNHAMNSKVMREKGITPVDTDLYFRMQLGYAGYNVDQDKWWKYARNSEEAFDWLIDKMEAAGIQTVLEINDSQPGDPFDQPVGSHSWVNDEITSAGLGQSLVVNELARLAQVAGVQIFYETVAEQLVREDNNTGRVSAVIAKGTDGTYTKYVGTKAIVLATGDFSADKEMMAKYCPRAIPLLIDTGSQGYDTAFKMGGIYMGDGQKMGLWVGAAWQKSTPNAPMLMGGAGPSSRPYGSHNGLVVNKLGRRYGNENVGMTYAGESQMHQPEAKSFAIWGINYAEAAAPWHAFGAIAGSPAIPTADVIAGWDKSVEGGRMVKADTIEEVISLLELPAEETKATIDRYNELCDKGVDDDFCKSAKWLIPISTGPFYGQIGSLTFLTVCGGLRTDINMQVCDENDEPIPGLFNVGIMVGDFFSTTYNFLIEGNNYGANCITFGYLTGRDLALGAI